MFYKEDIDMSYEFVSKNEYTPVRILLEEIIFEIQNKMKPEYTFQFSLIGSGRKKLITREVGSNKGFDFDYNFSLQKIKLSLQVIRRLTQFLRDLNRQL